MADRKTRTLVDLQHLSSHCPPRWSSRGRRPLLNLRRTEAFDDDDTSPPRRMNAPHELRCRYSGSRCENARAKKRNGELHNLCQMHRTKANENQKRTDEKKRSLKQSGSEDDADAGQQSQQDSDDGADKPPASPYVPLKDEDADAELRDCALDLNDTEIEDLTTLVVANVLQEGIGGPDVRIDQ